MESKKNKKQPDDEKINEPDLAVVSGRNRNNEMTKEFSQKEAQKTLIDLMGIPKE